MRAILGARGFNAWMILAALGVAPALAAPPYVLRSLSSDAGTTGVYSKAFAINRYGQVVGWTFSAGDQKRHATAWLNEQQSDLHGVTHFELQQDFTVGEHEAYDISDGDQIVGSGKIEFRCPERTLTVWRAFVMRPAVNTDLGTPQPGDAVTDLGTFGQPCNGAYNSAATAISNANHVVGWADVNGAATIRAFLVRPVNQVWFADANDDQVNDLMIDLGTLGGAESSASGVNDSGQVTGYAYTTGAAYHAFRITPVGATWAVDANNDGVNDLMTDLGTLGGTNSWGRGINNNGDVVGESDTVDGRTRAFVWRNGVMTDLGTLGGANSSAAAISDDGVIVGWAENAGGQRRAFIILNGVMHDLNSVILPGTSNGGITLTEARGINDAGEVVGFGILKSGGAQSERSFLMKVATAEQIAAAEAAGSANGGSGANAPSGGTNGGTPASGTPIMGTANTLGNPTDPNAPGVAGTTAESDFGGLAPLCGAGTVGFLPLMAAGLLMMRRRY